MTINLNPDPETEAAMLADLKSQIGLARERLLIVSAGNRSAKVTGACHGDNATTIPLPRTPSLRGG